ncbi:MAG: hypothetical protein ACP5VR_12490 [Acidimicrobiales bacterium]
MTSMSGYSARAIELRPVSEVRPGEQIIMPQGLGTVLWVDHFAPGTHFLAPLPRHWEAYRIATTAGEHWEGPGSLVSVYHPEKDLVGAPA